ncbi:MAG: ABC transporter permease [Alphaproteobacteria bacterium]|nr:ABC transporter permease [Alphaproteobacteria bacterium]
MLHGYEDQLWIGLKMTIGVASLSLLVGLVLGMLGATAKLSSNIVARKLADAYTTFVRGIPELILLLILIYGGTILAQKLFRALGSEEYVEIDAFTAGVLTLGFVFGAYATEVFRGAILSIHKGQIEAAQAIGMNRLQVFRRIMLPQVWRFALPGIGNLWLVLLKDTALISVIGLDELMRKTYVAAGSTQDPFTFFAFAAVIYLTLTAISMAVLQTAEKRLTRGVKRI